jgi:hypothetical protein
MDKFIRQGHEGVRFFVGPEIEQTPAFNKRTLFVVGLEETDLVERLAREHKTPHIFLSANRSFDSVDLIDGVYKVGDTLASDWAAQIQALLDRGFMVSLDYPAHKHEMVLKILNAGIWQSRNFVPVLSVAIPNVSTSSLNLTIKIDDVNFKATNPGVWCMNHHEVTDSNRFTSWTEYGDDMILTEDQIDTKSSPTPVLSVKETKIESYAEINQPGIDLVGVRGKVKELFDVKNDGTLGLDPDSKSALKPDEETKPEKKSKEIITAPSVADAYAMGAISDPMGADVSKIPKIKKV